LTSPAALSLDLLGQFLDCADSKESECLLARLVSECAVPIVKRIVSSKVRAPANEDVQNDVLADLITRLREMKESGNRGSIRDFSAYSAVTAFHGCKEYYRQCFPQRYRLRNRLRYLLRRHQHFALWEMPDGEWVCGRKELQLHQPTLLEVGARAVWASSRESERVVESILDECTAPLPFDDLVERVARHCGIFDQPKESIDGLVHQTASVETRLVQRGWLGNLWNEIAELPLAQRIALLLSMRDDQGGSALVLLPITGVASLRQIAAMLEMSAGELVRIWNDLPLEDQRIGQWLTLDRQRVINLRKSARERLNRRAALGDRKRP
jgi:hypothetical protein